MESGNISWNRLLSPFADWMTGYFGKYFNTCKISVLFTFTSSLSVILPLFDNFTLLSLALSNEKDWLLKFFMDASCFSFPSCNATCELPLPLKIDLQAAQYAEYMFPLTGCSQRWLSCHLLLNFIFPCLTFILIAGK